MQLFNGSTLGSTIRASAHTAQRFSNSRLAFAIGHFPPPFYLRRHSVKILPSFHKPSRINCLHRPSCDFECYSRTSEVLPKCLVQ
ncbi:unnamed protein product [Colias eurytheme]|nr:unnamed protein product [Colias eurytheme]